MVLQRCVQVLETKKKKSQFNWQSIGQIDCVSVDLFGVAGLYLDGSLLDKVLGGDAQGGGQTRRSQEGHGHCEYDVMLLMGRRTERVESGE